MVKKLSVVWNKRAEAFIQKAYIKIKEDSPQNAEKVKADILSETRKLADNPRHYPPDKYKKDNIGNYRAFEIHSYRISYKHTEQQVRILRIRHVKQKPKTY